MPLGINPQTGLPWDAAPEQYPLPPLPVDQPQAEPALPPRPQPLPQPSVSGPLPDTPAPPDISGGALPPTPDLGGPPDALPPPPAPPRPGTPAQDALLQAMANPPHPKWYQRLAAGALGAGVGLVNADARTHIDPAVANAATQNILGLSGYNADLKRKELAYSIERQKIQDEMAARENAAKVNLQNAQATEAGQRGQMYIAEIKKYAQDPKRYQVTPNGILDTTTGILTPVPPTDMQKLQINIDKAKVAGLKPGTTEWQEYVLTGKMSKPESPKVSYQTDKNGNVVPVIASGTNVTVGQPLGPIGKPEKAPEPKQTTMMIPDGQGGYTATSITAGQHVPAGAMTATGVNAQNVPTSTTRTMAETAPKINSLIDRTLPIIAAQKQKLGPAAGRWNDFMTGKVGASDPEFNKLRVNMGLLSTLLMRMHVGARGSEKIMEKFDNLIGLGYQSPDNLVTALNEIKLYANDVAESGRGHEGQGGTPAPAPTQKIPMWDPKTQTWK